MQIGVPRERWLGESRVALVPASAKKLMQAGFSVVMESGAGTASGFSDDAYTDAGAIVHSDRAALLSSSDVVLRVRRPDVDEVTTLKPDTVHISFLDPFNENELVRRMADRGVTAISMEMIPRSTRAKRWTRSRRKQTLPVTSR